MSESGQFTKFVLVPFEKYLLMHQSPVDPPSATDQHTETTSPTAVNSEREKQSEPQADIIKEQEAKEENTDAVAPTKSCRGAILYQNRRQRFRILLGLVVNSSNLQKSKPKIRINCVANTFDFPNGDTIPIVNFLKDLQQYNKILPISYFNLLHSMFVSCSRPETPETIKSLIKNRNALEYILKRLE